MVRAIARGFTLIEIMVVVVIMGILAALVVPKLMGRTDDARITAAKQDIATVMQALKLYKLDNQRYPTTEQGLQALIVKPTTGPAANGWKSGGYIDKLPKDPWGNAYLVKVHASGGLAPMVRRVAQATTPISARGIYKPAEATTTANP